MTRIRPCTQFDRRPTKQRALCNSITQSKVTKPIVKRFLRKKGQICPAKDDINDRVHNSSAIHCKECREKNRAEIRDWKNKCICLAKRDSTWIRAWCDTEVFIRLEAEVNATSKRLYNTHRQRVRKKGNKNHNVRDSRES